VLTIETVAVVGASERGTACAVAIALAGCAVRLHDPDATVLASAADAVRRYVDRALTGGAIGAPGRQRILDGVLVTPDLDEALTGADLFVAAGAAEPAAVVEQLSHGLRATSAIAAAGATTAAELAARVAQPGRVLALRVRDASGSVPRFEVVAGAATSPHVLARAHAFAARVNEAASLPVVP
jgi:3-hydroxybutyryl-CoA dehydrogenase